MKTHQTNSTTEISSINLRVTLADIERAYVWLIEQRKHYPADADIWFFRRDWALNKQGLLLDIVNGEYIFSPQQRICKQDGSIIHLWSAQDALLLKVISYQLEGELELSPDCFHAKGNGGLKQAVKTVQEQLPGYHFVCKTDVLHYYEMIDQFILSEQLYEQIEDPILRRYCWQIIHRSCEYGGVFWDITKGISRGCPLSPIFAALYLKSLDDAFNGNEYLYVRYMDDILILSKTRWQIRRVVKYLNEIFNTLKLKQHPDKTFIGRIDKGFDFLGYHFSRNPLQLAEITITKHLKRIKRLYEQQRRIKATDKQVALALAEYVKRWQRWCFAGLGSINLIGFYDDDLSQSNRRIMALPK